MLDGLIRLSLRHRGLVLLAAALWLAYGVVTIARLPVDVFPDLNRPTVTLLTEAGGLSPEEVELAISRPIEQAMAGAPGVERVRSQSGVGLSVVWVEFGWSVDPQMARQRVSERLSAAELPESVRPHLGPLSSIMGEILLVGLESPDGSVDGPELRRVAEQLIRPRLGAIPGVSQVLALGGGLEQIQVLVRPEALAARQVTLAEVREAAASAQAATTGGFLERKSQEYLVRNLARTADPEELGKTVVALREGAPVSLADVADLQRGVGVMRGDAGVNAHPGVVLSVQKQPGASTVALTAQINEALSQVSLPPGVELHTLFRQADFVSASVRNVEEALRDGAILVTLVLAAFLLSWRTTLISLVAIPLSFVSAALVLSFLGLSVNTMTLGGLAVAIGELVDDAIVDVENVHRRLGENAHSNAPKSALRVVYEASREVRGSIVFSTALVVLVFVPLFSLSGVEGRLFSPLGVAYIVSILASLLVSLTVTPALCSFLLSSSASTERGDSALVRWLKAGDERLLRWVLPRPLPVLLGVSALVLGAAASVPYLGTSFLPAFNEGTATINLLAAPGTSLEESDRLGQLAERLILSTPEVASVGRRTGRAEGDEHAEGVHYTEIDVDFRPGDAQRPRAEVLAEVRARLALIPGVFVNVGQPISHRLDHMLSGVRAAIAIKLFGEDLGLLRDQASALAAELAGVPGLVDLQTEQQVLIPQVRVNIDRERARRFGVSPGQLAEDLETALGGRVVAQVPEGLRTLDVLVRYGEESRNDVDTLRAAPLVLDGGRVVTLGQVAEVGLSTGPNQILHENGRRRIVLSANTAGRDVGSVVKDIEALLHERGEGLNWSIEGQFASQREASRRIGLLSLVSLLAMFAALYKLFRSVTLSAQVLLNIPLALIGSVAALWISGDALSVATLVGFVTLCGIASRNTILLISHYLHLMEHEGEAFGPEMVVRGSLERLVPVLMTALCAGLGLVPLAFAGGTPGKEILTPVARVILGGLVSSTLLDMLVTPTLFLRYGRDAAVSHARDREDVL